MNYENWLTEQLYISQQDCGLDEKFDFVIETEQLFSQRKSLTPNTIYIVIKYLSASISFSEKTQPIQLIILSEQNSLENARIILNTFANKNNFKLQIETNNSTSTYIKHQYNECVVLSNFQEITYGYRSLLYMSGTLSIMENVMDVLDFEIDGQEVKILSGQISYSMSGNTQNTKNNELATTVKSVATLSVSITVPNIKSYTFLNKVNKIINGADDGNKNFEISFSLGDENILKNMKLISYTLTTAPNNVPGVNIGFQL